MNRVGKYLLYIGSEYYPSAVTGDLVGGFDTIDEAKAETVNHHDDWAEIVEHATMVTVADGRCANPYALRGVPAEWEWS